MQLLFAGYINSMQMVRPQINRLNAANGREVDCAPVAGVERCNLLHRWFVGGGFEVADDDRLQVGLRFR